VLNIELVSGIVGVGDVIVDVGMILGVDRQPITIAASSIGDAPSVVPEFMAEYNATFGDEHSSSSRVK
jgi:hypothetical protein